MKTVSLCLLLLIAFCPHPIAPTDCEKRFPNGIVFEIFDTVGDDVTWSPIPGECVEIIRVDSEGEVVEILGADTVCFCDGSREVV